MLHANSVDASIVKIYQILQSHPDEMAYAFPYQNKDLWWKCYKQLQKEIEKKQDNGREILQTIQKTVDTLGWGNNKRDAVTVATGGIYAVIVYQELAAECLISTEDELKTLSELSQQPLHILTLPIVKALNRAKLYPRGQRYRDRETWYE